MQRAERLVCEILFSEFSKKKPHCRSLREKSLAMRESSLRMRDVEEQSKNSTILTPRESRRASFSNSTEGTEKPAGGEDTNEGRALVSSGTTRALQTNVSKAEGERMIRCARGRTSFTPIRGSTLYPCACSARKETKDFKEQDEREMGLAGTSRIFCRCISTWRQRWKSHTCATSGGTGPSEYSTPTAEEKIRNLHPCRPSGRA
ncbi:unnamed protein product [Trichogramma brassicae]|uniref:Uncharacterized protein n=1 Tax=Trichogramma brassicae TaxID=86971 RepID=A0A6H5HXM6_9HYME|nr:unnamed protein product [Trichogramma brassicae]